MLFQKRSVFHVHPLTVHRLFQLYELTLCNRIRMLRSTPCMPYGSYYDSLSSAYLYKIIRCGEADQDFSGLISLRIIQNRKLIPNR